jgi:hypothetical protein
MEIYMVKVGRLCLTSGTIQHAVLLVQQKGARGIRITRHKRIARIFLYVRLILLFLPYSYVKSHLDDDSCLPIYKTNPAICDTPHQTHCIGNSIFPHFVIVMTMLWAELWFVVECRALFFFLTMT